jgi:hypothetical protein
VSLCVSMPAKMVRLTSGEVSVMLDTGYPFDR